MLEGKYFHARDPETRVIHFQGRVVAYLPPRVALVQLFSFLDGEPSTQRLLDITEHWDFYDSNQEMLDVYAETQRVASYQIS